MSEKPLFVVRVAGTGGYYQNGYTASTHPTRQEADAALEKLVADAASRSHVVTARVEDWTPTPRQVEAYRESQE